MILRRDDAYGVVCSIRTPSQAEEEVGTGIFVQRGTELFIVTASHVARPCNAATYLVISDASGGAQRVTLAALVGSAAWRHHPVADLAAISVSITPTNQQYLQSRFFPFDHIDPTKQGPSRDVELTALGFPLGLGATGKFSPFSFRTFASSSAITLPRFDTQGLCEFFILENPSIGGYSGGPVFDLGYMVSGLMTQTKEKTLCHGFMHGTISDNTGGKLAAVTPAWYLDRWL